LKKLFIQHNKQEKSSFTINGKVFKLRKDRIYTKKEYYARGGGSNIYAMKELCLKTFKVLNVARKQARAISPEEIRNEYAI
jgi:hypothetical protein